MSSIKQLGVLGRLRDGKLDAKADDASRNEFLRELTSRATKPQNQRLWFTAAAAAVMLTAVTVTMWPDPALSYNVVGASNEDGYVHADTEPARIEFEDGTTFDLKRGTASRLVDVDEHGARLLVEHGEMTAHVTPLSDARWEVAAGPYSIAVIGTEFVVGWQPDSQRFSVTLTEGSIIVSGPMAEPGLELRAGQQLVAHVGRGDLQLVGATSQPLVEPTLVAPSASASAASPAAPTSGSSASASLPTAPIATPAELTWAQLNAAGRYADVMSSARGRGIDGVLASASMGELVALGDAARYTGDGGVSRQVLVALRKRYPSSGAARTAAFLLGRIAEGGSAASAITWYDRYLAESPGGAYASEALGRKMVLLSKSNSSQARAAARQYLKYYPKGGYAHVARKLTGAE